MDSLDLFNKATSCVDIKNVRRAFESANNITPKKKDEDEQPQKFIPFVSEVKEDKGKEFGE